MTGTIPAGRPRTAELWGLPVRISPFVPEGTVVVLNGDPLRAGVDVLLPSGRALFINPGARDRFGAPAWLLRAVDPRPGYTRHSLGERELARDVRRQRRPRYAR